jgi:polysaccharide export outer membrane protein
LVGLAYLLGTARVFPAVLLQESGRGGKAGATGTVKQQAFKGEETLISANDLLFIQVFDVEQMTREYRVSATGTIDFTLLAEPVQVADLTPEQAAKAIAQKCIAAGVLARPQISVTIRESRIHAVAVTGSVKAPQLYPVFGRISLLDILAQAGGVADDAGPAVVITRGEVSRRVLVADGGGTGQAGDPSAVQTTVTINLQRLLANSDPSLNVDVYPGDRVNVPRAGIVYVMGAVNRAGGYLLSDAHQDMTVLKAVALAGSLGPFAKAKRAVLLRPAPSAPGGREEIRVNLTAMMKGMVSDQPMRTNDILFVPDSTALKALHKSADIAATSIGLAAVYTVAP